MLENVENYNNIQKDIPNFNTIHNGERIFFSQSIMTGLNFVSQVL